MRNFIGNFLIILASIIGFIRTVMLFALTVGFVMGILVITLIAFFELVGRASPNSQALPMAFDLFGKWYWELIVVVIGGSTMWLGVQKMFETDKEKKPDVGKGWGNHNYNYGNKK